MKVLLLLGVFIVGHFGVQAQCPGKCVCQETLPEPVAICSHLNLIDILPAGDSNEDFTKLDISYNSISRLHHEAFSVRKLLKLSYLNISHNIIETLSESAFELMVDVKILDLSFNKLTNLQTKAFDPLSYSLEELYLNDNPLLAITQGFSFVRLTQLDLSNCHLKILPERFFEEMTTLIHLNLQSNDIEHTKDLADISSLTKLTNLNLKQNKMSALPRELLHLNDAILIDLAENPLICDCEFLNNMFFMYEERTYSPGLLCYHPSDIAGRLASTELADERCNTVVVIEDAGVSVAHVWIVMGVISFFIFVVIACLETKYKCFDCVGNKYAVAESENDF